MARTYPSWCIPCGAPLPAAVGEPHIGVDEAGRGCLAGPVVAAAVILPETLDIKADLPGLNDSKQLSAREREALAPRVRSLALAWGIGLSWPPEIDRVNILNATFRAMSRAVLCLGDSPLPLLIDGNQIIRESEWRAARNRVPGLPRQTAIIKGDARIPTIAAASILAKVFRDSLMTALDKRYPGYSFAAHKGYASARHCAAIAALGSCALHRRSFRKTGPETAPSPIALPGITNPQGSSVKRTQRSGRSQHTE